MEEMLEEDWTDIGANADAWGGKCNQNTCRANAAANESRIDYILVNDAMFPMATGFEVDRTVGFCTHHVIQVKIDTAKKQEDITTTRKIGSLMDMLRNQVKEELKDTEATEKQKRDKDRPRRGCRRPWTK